MNSGTLILIIIVWSAVTIITGYFFWKVLTTKKHGEPDSYTENDDQE
ncbi:MAG: hypothetical protein JNJ99_08555 [Crocinitomicaceae bacterium]|nr:hypothetical protein [Crocinitomicaceae bacterium]